ncbi:Phenylacetaldoxime dehydratase [Lasiodiplodia theobromae]|uniref:Phenylacetaldoxime dehydratase n=1 Tax=Lasiodiplodia theobromae TaxID=45133 RepID=UPI0015C2F5C1|nr:Phenylacetaldoxime dehydratase [Lasiodiplodia theobromae]KAF4539563.1 Phenylacetaldoxime dehydratase [Lasiodiplodia theobromae]
MLEPAIPPHLQRPRTCPARLPHDAFEPPNAAYCARFPESITDLVMATICAQARSPAAGLSRAADVLAPVIAFLKHADGKEGSGDSNGEEGTLRPSAFDLISFRDAAGHHNVGVIAYWPGGRARFEEWAEASGFEAWWRGLDTSSAPPSPSSPLSSSLSAASSSEGKGKENDVGWFREVFFPTLDRYETVFSNQEAGEEGAARMRAGMSGPVREHVYWGSMRDRMPASQVDGLEGEKARTAVEGTTERHNSRVVVPGKKNLCVIRSGQDWSAMLPAERKLYLETIHPVLVKGMDFLRDEGRSIGCHSCRFVDELDLGDERKETERTFGFAFFEDMESLEKWSKSHRTHLDIFGRFLQYVKELDGNISLRLFHEVLVLKPEQQLLEYVGCHPKTGLMGV